jgi:hypothetical protein
MLGLDPPDDWILYEPDRNPEFSAVNPNLEYGHIRIEGTGYDLFLGPVFTVPLTKELVRDYFADAHVRPEHREEVEGLLYSIPLTSHPQLIRILTFLHFILNGKEAYSALLR